MQDVNFEEYYNMVRLKLIKKGKTNENYFNTLELLMGTIMVNNDYTELEKISILRDIVYTNGSLSKKELKEIEEDLGYEKYYETIS